MIRKSCRHLKTFSYLSGPALFAHVLRMLELINITNINIARFSKLIITAVITIKITAVICL